MMDHEHIPGTILARTSDSVLDEDDWSIYRIYIEDGVIKRITESYKGVQYSTPDLVGATIEALVRWTHLDTTGQHPETYQELYVSGAWFDFVSAARIRDELAREE